MGKVIVSASIENGRDPSFRIQGDALVDTVVDMASDRLAKFGRVYLKGGRRLPRSNSQDVAA